MKWWVLLLAGAAPLFGQCTYNISPQSLSFTAAGVPTGGSSGTITVTTSGAICAWSYSTDSPSWITLSAQGASNNSITGSGTVTVTAAASTLPVARTGNILIQGGSSKAIVPVSQGAAQCSMTLNPVSSTLPAGGGSSSFAVQTSCTWSAVTNTSWITLGTNSGTGSGSVTYSAAPNTCVDTQSGAIAVSSQPNQIFTVTETGSPNNLVLSPSTLAAPLGASTGRVSVATGDPCNWSAFSDVNWIHITTTSSGKGNGGIGYSIDANTGAQRTGNIHVGPQLFMVTQAGVIAPALQLSAVVNAASYASGTVAPGEIVALFGSNMGPAQAAGLQLSADKQSITSAVAGVQALFDGNPAPLTFVSSRQINAIAPAGISGKSSTQVQVSYQGVVSNAITVPVVAAAPGVFSADGSGTGGGAILNQDYSANTRLNPASRGSVIAIYVTGSGATTPASVDGAITSVAGPYPSVAQTVTVTVGGVPVPDAQVVYRGAAPGSVEGLTQIDAYIPQSVTPGPAVPVVVTVGGVPSQPGITISVN